MSSLVKPIYEISRRDNNPYHLEIGDVLIVDGNAFVINARDRLYYDYGGVNTTPLTQGTSRTDTITDLKPEDDEIEWIESMGIDGPVTVQSFYPQGIPRGTPHNIPQYLDQSIAHKGKPLLADLWITPGTQPQVALLMPAASVSTTSDIWFYGLKFKIKSATEADVEFAKNEGRTVLNVPRIYQ